MNWLISFSRPFFFRSHCWCSGQWPSLGANTSSTLRHGFQFPANAYARLTGCLTFEMVDQIQQNVYIYIYEIPGFSYKQTTLLISYILYIPPIPISYWHVWHQWTPISNSPMVPPPFQEKILDGQRVAATLHCTTKEEMVSAPRFWPIWEWMETYDSMIYPLVI